MPILLVALAETVTLPDTVATLGGCIMDTLGATPTVTVMDTEVRVPEPLRAVAVIVCGPFVAVVESHVLENGAVTTSVPRFTASILNWTPTIPAATVVKILTVPVTAAPLT